MNDDVESVIDRYRALSSAGSGSEEVPEKIELLLLLEAQMDPRAFLFLLGVAANDEYDLARIEAFKILGVMELRCDADRERLARVAADVLRKDEDDDVRDYAAMALANVMSVPEAMDAIESVVTDPAESRNLRHNAFFALERAEPTARATEVLQKLLTDEDLAVPADRVLSQWRGAH